jgi:hypothetical protein
MRAPRDIVKHVGVEIAKAKRKCHRSKQHRIAMGEKCVVIKEGSFGSSKNYCAVCAIEILDAADQRILGLREEMGIAH